MDGGAAAGPGRLRIPRPGSRRRARARLTVAAAALAVLGALLAIDCLNLVGAATWSDPARSPHLGAIHQARHRGVLDTQRSPLSEPGDLPPAAALVAAVLVVVMVAVATRCPALVQDRKCRSRGPPSLRFAGVRL
jgi:hypothetical protein